VSAKIFLNTTNKKTQHSYFLQLNKNFEERVDGVKANDASFDNLLFLAGTGIKKHNSSNSFYGINFTAQYKMPLSDTFKVLQTNEGYFTRYVIYHDYLYNTSSYLGGSITGEYGLPVFKTMQASFKLNACYMQKLNQKTLNRTIISEPGKDRFSSNISLNLYF